MKLIDGDALGVKLDKELVTVTAVISSGPDSDYSRGVKSGLMYAVRDVRNAPTVVPEDRTAEWKLLNYGEAQCSNCMMIFKNAWCYDFADNYCRHCGRKMRVTA